MFSIFRPRVALNSARQGLWASLYFPVVHDGARSAHDHACDAKSQRVLHLRLFNNLNRDQIVNQDSYRCSHVPKPKMKKRNYSHLWSTEVKWVTGVCHLRLEVNLFNKHFLTTYKEFKWYSSKSAIKKGSYFSRGSPFKFNLRDSNLHKVRMFYRDSFLHIQY